MHYQELLVLANQKLKKGEDVPVKLEREPSNPYDSNAITFTCLDENDWERIGYVVSETHTDVNEAISNNTIHSSAGLSILYTTSNLDGMLVYQLQEVDVS